MSTRKPRGPVFEVKKNHAGDWYWHEKSNGRIVDVSQAYSPGTKASKSNAKRAARRKSEVTLNARFVVLD